MGRSTILPDDSESFEPDAVSLARLEAARDAANAASAARLEAAQNAAVRLVAAQNAAVNAAGNASGEDDDGSSEGGGSRRSRLAGYVLSLLSRGSEEIVVNTSNANVER